MSKERGAVDAEHFCSIPKTPIAAELYTHFAEGGSIKDAIKLVERLERATAQALAAKRATISAAGGPRGSRLPSDWAPSDADVSFALQRGIPPLVLESEIEKFLNYWTAKCGAGAIKRDWSATWRNWIITAMERGNGTASYRGTSPANVSSRSSSTGSDAILAGMGRLANRIDQRRMPTVLERRRVPDDPNPSFAFDVEPS